MRLSNNQVSDLIREELFDESIPREDFGIEINPLIYKEYLFQERLIEAFRLANVLSIDREGYVKTMKNTQDYLEMSVQEIVEYLEWQSYQKDLEEMEFANEILFFDLPENNPYNSNEGLD